MVDDISDEELERRMRAKLLPDGRWERTVPDQERRMAERLVGRPNVDRLVNAKEGRRVRPIAVRVHYEYYRIPDTPDVLGGWRIVRVENGRQEDHHRNRYGSDVMEEVARLQKRGFLVRQIHMGFAPRQKEQKPESRRKRVLDSLSSYKVGGR